MAAGMAVWVVAGMALALAREHAETSKPGPSSREVEGRGKGSRVGQGVNVKE